MGRRLAFLVLALASSTAALAEKTYIETPGTPWGSLLPYVRANIVPVLQGKEFSVYVGEDQMDRTTVTPFNDQLGDFAKVLVHEGRDQDDAVERGIRKVTDAFKTRAPTMTDAERATYKQSFWDAIVASPSVLPRLRLLYQKAQKDGSLRCHLCDHEEKFAPRARRVVRAH